ncbi:MAG: hypothetical protein FGM14_08500 [Flavobacteriales bacterium]|nr:hypothetical protein [Flavobacteriales bacterium]
MLPNFSQLFSNLPAHSRVWLYLADRKLDATEANYVNEQMQHFLSNWAAHNKKLACDGVLLFNQYLILAVDEDIESASGCSIDSSVRFVKALGTELKVDFFDRLKVMVLENGEPLISNYFEAVEKQQNFINPMITKLEELRGVN